MELAALLHMSGIHFALHIGSICRKTRKGSALIINRRKRRYIMTPKEKLQYYKDHLMTVEEAVSLSIPEI